MLASNNPIELDQAREMLQFIPAHDRETWTQIGMALKAEFGNDGFSLFDSWSEKLLLGFKPVYDKADMGLGQVFS